MLNNSIDIVLTSLNTFNRNTEIFQRVEIKLQKPFEWQQSHTPKRMSALQTQDSLVMVATAAKRVGLENCRNTFYKHFLFVEWIDH